MPANNRRTGRESLLCFAGLLGVFLLTISGHDNSEEAEYSYRVARQMLAQHRLGFDQPQSGVFNRAPDGEYYGSYELGSSLVMLPWTSVEERLQRILIPRAGEARALFVWRFVLAWLAPVYCAAGLACIYALLRAFFLQSRRAALANVLIVGFCSYYWNYSRNLTDLVLCGTLLCAATLPLFLYTRNSDPKCLIAAFCFLGMGLITRPTMLIPAAAAFLYLFTVFRFDWKRLFKICLIVCATLLPFVAWQLYYNHLRTGGAFISPLRAFYAEDNGFSGNLPAHLPALLISPGKGVFVYAPPVLLAVFCFPAFYRRYRAEAVFIAAVGLGWLLLHASLAKNWYGAWAWGPRHFVAIVALAAVPFVVCRSVVFQSARKLLFERACLVFGFVLAACATIGDWLYRLGLANAKGRGDFLWSLTESQSIDMIVSSARNVARLFVSIPYDVLPGTSLMNQQASNTVNVWLLTAYRQGVPAIPLVCVALLLAGAAAGSFWLLLRSETGG